MPKPQLEEISILRDDFLKGENGFVIAKNIEVFLVGDLATPNTKPYIKVRCDIQTINSTTKGRRGSRHAFFNPETEEFTKRPNGKVGWPIDFTNRDQVIAVIRKALAEL